MKKNKKFLFFVIISIIAVVSLIYMPSHSRYYKDDSGELVISGKISMNFSLLSQRVLDSEYISNNASTSYTPLETDTDGYVWNSSFRLYNAGYHFTGSTPDNYVYYNCPDTYDGIPYGEGGYNYSRACERWRIVSIVEGSGGNYYTRIVPDNPTLSYAWNDSGSSVAFTSSTLYTNLTAWRNSLSTISKNLSASAYEKGNTYSSTTTSIPSLLTNLSNTSHTVAVSLLWPLDYQLIKSWINITSDEWMVQKTGSTTANYITSTGSVSTASVSTQKTVRPLIYLKTNVLVKSGSGTYTSPYVLATGYSLSYYYSETMQYREFTAPKKGYYFFELSGAQGGFGQTNGVYKYAGGGGSTTAGYVFLKAGEKLYIYIGGSGGNAHDSSNGYGTAGYNGGGRGGADSNYASAGSNEYAGGGGGASDVRCFYNESTGLCEANTENLAWDDELGLNSRIMVAAGGGGGAFAKPGGDGGAIYGGLSHSNSIQSTQTSGGAFGIGQTGVSATGGCGGGGGGYWGGSGGPSSCNGLGGSGGSSYISGLLGSVAITSATDRTPRTVAGETGDSPDGTATIFECSDSTIANSYSECSYHYSGKIFEYPNISSGINHNYWYLNSLIESREEYVSPDEDAPFNGNGEIIFVGMLGEKTPTLAYNRSMGFSYTGKIQEYVIPYTGYYSLKVWGAQGGQANHWSGRGGFGGYAEGIAFLEEGTLLYVVVGGMGGQANKSTTSVTGGYNGGGNAGGYTDKYVASGGGATHFATVTGLLKELSGYKGVTDGGTTASDKILIVGGGGGGGGYEDSSKYGTGGNAGGYKGGTGGRNSGSYTRGTGGTQTAAGGGGSSGAFGRGGNRTAGSSSSSQGTGGGGGWFGGGGGQYYCGGGGGSSYIGSALLVDALSMYFYTTYSQDNSDRQMVGYGVTEYIEGTDEKLYTTADSDSASANHAVWSSNVGLGYAEIEIIQITDTAPSYS